MNVSAVLPTCASFKPFFEPYKQGYRNICAGVSRTPLPLDERIKRVVIGLLLWLPFLNIAILNFLQITDSRFVYGEIAVSCEGELGGVRKPFHFPEVFADDLVINNQNLGLIPDPIIPMELTARIEAADPVPAIDELLTIFDSLFADKRDGDYLYTDQDGDRSIRINKGRAKNDIREKFITFVNGYQNERSYVGEVAREFKLYLPLIVLELRSPTMDVDRKKTILINLASAARHCAPRRHEEVSILYRKLCTREIQRPPEEEIRQVLLEYNQIAKEELIMQYYSLSTEPVMTLHYIQREVGQELGLNCTTMNIEDPFINTHNDARSPENSHRKHTTAREFREVFNRIYTPANLVPIMRGYLNDRMEAEPAFQTKVGKFIRDTMLEHHRRGDVRQEEIDALPMPYQYDFDREAAPFHLTNEGVKFLLIHFGILTSLIPNGHLIRMPATTTAS